MASYAPRINLSPVEPADFEELARIRIEAMRDSLERISRFDPQRARERLLGSFAPEATRHILLDEERIGFLTTKVAEDHLHLEHLYIRPEYQNRGIGSLILLRVIEEANASELPIRLGALRGSESNRFYQRHGFVRVAEGEWDIHYVRGSKASTRSAEGGLFGPE